MKETLLKLLLGQLWTVLKPVIEKLLTDLSAELLERIERYVNQVATAGIGKLTGEEKRAEVLAKVAADPKFAGVSKSSVNLAIEAAVAKLKRK